MCLLSIIIPNYNNGKFLNRCLDSILSAKEQNIEVIVIDDGSIDNSVQVLQKYNDYRLTYYTQANKGVSATRNRGIELAKGKYITFCDADDYYTENAIDDLTGQINMTNEDPDIFVFNAYQETIEENGHRNRKIWTNATSERIDTAATQPIDCGIYMEFVVQNSNMNCAVNKVYKNTLLTAGEVSFPVSLGIGEDGIFNLKCAARCHKVVYIPATFYVYCYGESEFTSGKLRNKTGRLNETIRGFEERKSIIDEYCNKSKVSEERVKKLERLHEDYMIEQLYHQAKGVKANVGSSAFKEYVKNNSAMREACWHLILRGTNMKRKIQSIVTFYMMRF